MTTTCSFMNWGPAKVIFRIYVLCVFNYQFANFKMSTFCSLMQWGVSKIIFRNLVLYVFNYQFANLEMTISCSFMKWCPVPLFLRMFVFYKFNYQFAYFQMTSRCSQMQWSGSNKMISRILILNVLIINLQTEGQTFIEITFLKICKSLIKKGIVYHFKEVHKYLLSYLP